MVRIAVVAAIVALFAPAPTFGQWFTDVVDEPEPRFRIVPYATIQVPYMVRGTWGFQVDQTGEREFFDREEVYQTSIGMGLQASQRIGTNWGMVASATYSPRVDREVRLESWEVLGEGMAGEVEIHRAPGPDLFMGRVAAFYEIPRREHALQGFPVRGSVSLGPSVIRQGTRTILGVEATTIDPIYNFGANFGVDASLPLAMVRGLSIYGGLESHLAFWNTAEMERQERRFWEEETGEIITFEYDYNPGLIAAFRFGVSFDF